jgi:hypothetical protein
MTKKPKTNMRGAVHLDLFVKIVIAIILIVILGSIIRKSLNDSSSTLFKMFEKYKPAKLDSTAFLYSAKDIEIVDIDNTGCVPKSHDDTNYFQCPAGKPIEFSVTIHNGNSKMLKLSGATVICEINQKKPDSLPKDCGSKLTTQGSSSHYINSEKDVECEAGSFTFEKGKVYIVYAAAQCVLNQDYGCSAPGMFESDKYYNPDKYIIVGATSG